jgi:hypothetical protein
MHICTYIVLSFQETLYVYGGETVGGGSNATAAAVQRINLAPPPLKRLCMEALINKFPKMTAASSLHINYEVRASDSMHFMRHAKSFINELRKHCAQEGRPDLPA